MKQVFFDSLSLEDAFQLLFNCLDSTAPGIPSEVIDVRNSIGRITAEAVFARYSSPFYHSSAMDGYAVRFADTFTASETSPSLLEIGYDAIYV
ncbi:MAG: molybdopterin biosynthesis protein, partial [Nitrospirae bacterium]|nr:molybdopterin biosynthesis protein [Nitrospirota bacterium]